ncbi:MAG: hypothetical protein IH900_12025 [Proteobacteria bacterium]|nr:hypothetical protein [Pseudomonadota bacterium]
MANNPFIVGNTISGLGASDLANLMGATYVMGFGALAGGALAGTAKPGKLRALRRALRRLGALRLRDPGLDRDAC